MRVKLPTWIKRISYILLILVCAPLLVLTACQSKLIYFPRPYEPGAVSQWQSETRGKFIDVTTSQGNQRSYLQGNLKNPRNLWIVCGGNGTVALDWSAWLREHGPGQDAWLLVDMPGYGESQGSPTPARIRETFNKAIPRAMLELGWSMDTHRERLRIFGHSLGSAGCLMAATDFGIQSGVLIAPFTSTMDMARHITGLPVGFLVWHRMDNDARLAEIRKHGPGRMIILHGLQDEVIPVEMSRTLHAHHPDLVKLILIPGGRHNTIQQEHPDLVSSALREIAKP